WAALPCSPDACCIRIGPCGNNLDYEIEGVAPRTGAEWWARLAEVGGEGKCGTMNPTIRPPESFSCASLQRFEVKCGLFFICTSLAEGRDMFSRSNDIASFDPELWSAMQQEAQRQEEHIELIASENYTSPAVMQAQGSVLTNKYAEGYPGKRYYGGCEFVDVAEQLAIDRAKALFGADYANVQPHAGSQANSAVFQALLQAGDTVLGMSLAHGGHLTHGAAVNFSGKMYN